MSTVWPASVDAGPLDCTAARWPGFSEECWSCLCGACAPQLDKCNTDCAGVLECAITNQTFGNVAVDLQCEELLTVQTCVKQVSQVQSALAVVPLDACLLTSPKKLTGEFRTCDTACGIHYPGGICARSKADAGSNEAPAP